jgi:hypothetical protein
MSTMLAEFRRFQHHSLSSNISVNAAIRSCLTISQQALKNAPMYPSRPGAFSGAVWRIAVCISSISTSVSSSCRPWRIGLSRSQLKVFYLVLELPKCLEKKSCKAANFASWVIQTVHSWISAGIWLRRHLVLARRWKNFELASPTRIQVSLDLCRILTLLITVRPRILFWASFLDWYSAGVSSLWS